MGCLGVHYALTQDEAASLRSLPEEQARLDYIQEEIEEHYFNETPDFKAESDKAWDAMHRTLTDGELSWDGGEYPFSHVVLGGESLYTEPDYIVSLKTPEQVRAIAAALPSITQEDFRRRYFAISEDSYGFPISDEDLDYTWHWFQVVRNLYTRAANEGRFVLFTADQ